MESERFNTPTDAYFGDGASKGILEILNLSLTDHVLVIASDGAFKRAGVADLVTSLRGAAHVSTYSAVKPNPRVSDIDACSEEFHGAGITHVVGIGGGSALDQAKATSMTLELGLATGAILERSTPLPARKIKLVLVPTTSGTGAELSFGAILTDEVKGEKLGMRGEALAADIAIVDPELTYSTPVGISMTTGFDVLTHALETWLSNKATDYTKNLSREALVRVFCWLPKLFKDGDNKDARREMAYASMIMGANLALSTTCLPHRLQYPIGAATDTAHADGLAAIYPAWLAQELLAAPEKLAEAATWIGLAEGDDVTADAARFCSAVVELMATIDMKVTLQDLGVSSELIALMPSQVSGKLDTDPCYSNPEVIAQIYHDAFGGLTLGSSEGISK